MTSAEIDHAMKHRLPVNYDGIRYARITEYVSWYDDRGRRRLSVGLLDRNGKCVVRVLADKTEIDGGTANG